MTTIGSRLRTVKSQIEQACIRAGRDPGSVTLVAVSKRHSEESIRQAWEAGQRDFGENYAQELRDKSVQLADLEGIKWHFIGHLQRNKTKYVVPSASLVETIDSIRLARDISDRAVRLNRKLSVLVQVNVGGEEQKSGCEPDEAGELVSAIEKMSNIEVAGLMTIPPWDLEAEETRLHFKALAGIREKLGGAQRLPHLSMGMSHDFQQAVEEGATYVRVGTAIFGQRPPRD